LSRARKTITIISLVILIFALVFVVYKLFQVRKVTVTGCEAIAPQEVAEITGIENGQSVFLIDTEAAIEALNNDPRLKPLDIVITYPDRVTVSVEERKETAYVEKDGVLLAIDGECHVMRAVNNTSEPLYPRVFGLKMDTFDIGKRLGVGDTFQLDVLSRTLVGMADTGIGLYGIDVAWPANIVVQTKDGYTVELGDDTRLNEKLSMAQKAIIELESRGFSGGVLDVSSVTKAYYREK